MIMKRALGSLASKVEGGQDLVADLINNYYASIGRSDDNADLDSYCDLFRHQMATWQIVPALMTSRLSDEKEFSEAIQRAYGSFGIAWRLMDDIQDVEADMSNGIASSVYACLPDDIRECWGQTQGRVKAPAEQTGNKDDTRFRTVSNYIMQHNIIETITNRICHELRTAAAIADEIHLPGLAEEFRSLSRPLEHHQENG